MSVTEIENKINARLLKDGYVLAPGVAQKLFDEAKQERLKELRETDTFVDGMLKSLGQSLDGNLKAKSEKQIKFIDENFALKHLLKCQKEVEEVT